MKKNKKEILIEKGYELTKKLAKTLTKRDLKRNNISYDAVLLEFDSLAEYNRQLINKHPELETLLAPVSVTLDDIQAQYINEQGLKVKAKNKETIYLASLFHFLERFTERVYKGRVSNKIKKNRKKFKRAQHLILSDLHIGSDIEAEETGFLNFGKVEESRRLAAVIKQAVGFKEKYRKDTELHLNLLGDIIQNKLHDEQDAAPIAEQCCRAIHLLVQAITVLAMHFPKVTVHCATGNHGRMTSRHKKRATSGKWDSIETVIYYSLKQALSNLGNVTFDIPKTPYVIYEVFGHKCFATHGDTVLNVGNPGKTLRISSIEQQLNTINATLPDQDEIKVAMVGHTHCASFSKINSGVNMITNGALVPIDPFTVSIGILESHNSLALFESIPSHPVGDIRFIEVGVDDDKDESLDNVIKPWEKI